MRSESVSDFMSSGRVTTGITLIALEQGLITSEDAQILKEFWQTMTRVLPNSFYDIGETRLDHLTIAYRRYCDGLLQNGSSERRIANGVMGLESLFLKGGEMQELTYRLSIRAAKVLALMGYDPFKVKEVIKDAYGVRSLFVHGSHLSYKEERSLTREYGDVKRFLLLLLDYLRISVIIMMFTKMEKERFLDFIDDALIDKDKEQQLIKTLAVVQSVIPMRHGEM